MPKITLYTTLFCPFCSRAKALLAAKGAAFNEIDIGMDLAKRQEMEHRSGRHTVPQIFIGGKHIGGCDDLHALDAEGALDPLLAGA